MNYLSDVLYLLNKHSKQLLYFYPELITDPLLRKHLQTVSKLNEHHVESLTKDIKTGEISNPMGNVVNIGQLAGLNNVQIQHVFDPQIFE